MILSITLNPCVDHTVFVQSLELGDTNRVLRTETDAGGKGVNLSRIAVELGGQSLASGFLGGGPGAFVRKVLDLQGVAHGFVDIAEDTRTNFNVESLAGGPPTTFNAAGPTISAAEWEALLHRISTFLPRCTWVAMGGSLPPGVPPDAFRVLGEMAQSAGKKWVLDADGPSQVEGLKARPHFIKPNLKEAERLLGHPIGRPESALDAARELYDQMGGEDRYAIISLGRGGAVMACAEGVYRGRSPQVEARSTIGSGDSLIGGMLLQLDLGASPDQALQWGLAAGAGTATTDGSEIGRRPVIESLLGQAQVEKVSD
ncbi:MAG TPA: 1-phosphofructokinase family hexose kinase [Fimbriimonadaceae bacterium]|nr:1-phosphofructokinase family hexose kinase [Fimbriimonadaceae bacterium]HRJ33467.1 1-phosphofructokinase family hexose kinase [Fimbriimonadaceae bacterium]